MGRRRVVVAAAAAAAGGLERGIGRVVVGGIAAAVMEEDGYGLVGGEACVRGAHGSLAAAAAATFARLSLVASLSRLLACSLARLPGLRGIRIADNGRGGGCGGGTGTCRVVEAAHHHRACERRRGRRWRWRGKSKKQQNKRKYLDWRIR